MGWENKAPLDCLFSQLIDNYQNWLMCIEVIVWNVSVDFWNTV